MEVIFPPGKVQPYKKSQLMGRDVFPIPLSLSPKEMRAPLPLLVPALGAILSQIMNFAVTLSNSRFLIVQSLGTTRKSLSGRS